MSGRIIYWGAFATLGALLAAGCRGRSPRPARDTWEDRARFHAPAGWEREEDSFGPDRALHFSRGDREIHVQFLGGPGSRYLDTASFLKDMGSAREGQSPARPSGAVSVSGKSVMLYERSYSIYVKYPHQPSPDQPTRVREIFCLLPAGPRFFALSYSYSEPSAGSTAADPAWPEFLRSFEPLAS